MSVSSRRGLVYKIAMEVADGTSDLLLRKRIDILFRGCSSKSKELRIFDSQSRRNQPIEDGDQVRLIFVLDTALGEMASQSVCGLNS